jgi:adenosylcobinamide-GDP ribazoletransferase
MSPLLGFKVFLPMATAAATSGLVILLCYKKIKAYTGDCCGACFILSELVFYVAMLAIS